MQSNCEAVDHYAANNPVKYVDPDGRNTYLIIWATSDEGVGHAGFAVDNYDENGRPDGTVTYYDLWPGIDERVDESNVTKDVKAYYGNKIVNKSDLFTTDVSGGERGKMPDGIIEFSTTQKKDNKTKAKLERFMSSNDKYNAKSRNCSDMAKVGVKSSKKGFKIGLGKERFYVFTFTTPNSLFNDSKDFKNATVTKDPREKTDYSFRDNIVEPEVKRYLQEKKE